VSVVSLSLKISYNTFIFSLIGSILHLFAGLSCQHHYSCALQPLSIEHQLCDTVMVGLITEMSTKWLCRWIAHASWIHWMKGWFKFQVEWTGVNLRFWHATWNSMQLKIYELFIFKKFLFSIFRAQLTGNNWSWRKRNCR
jgi:hypothetical protein